MRNSLAHVLLLCVSVALLSAALLVFALDASRPLAPSVALAAGLPQPLTAPNAVTGIVYRDYNANGTQDALEPGVAGVLVTAYNAAGVAVGSSTTVADGSYSLSVADGLALRIQFTNIPAGFQMGPGGPQSRTSVTFVTSPATGVSLALNRPSEFCQSNPNLVTSCFSRGYLLTTTNEPAIVSFPYLSSGASPMPADLANANQVGSVWGIAYQRTSNNVFAAAFLKRHSGFGPSGPGAIYRIDRANPLNVSLLVDLNAAFPAQLPGGNDPRVPNNASYDWFHDAAAFPLVGKVGLGDLDIFEDDATLYTVGLNDRALYKIPIATAATGTTRFPIPSPCANASDARPFALVVKDGLVYVGGVCNGEAGGTNSMQAYVYSFTPATNTFAGPVFSFALTYTRRCVDFRGTATCFSPATWNPWTNTFTGIPGPSSPDFNQFMAFPQPWLTDIVFDNANMILGLRDRYGDQMGNASGSTDLTDNTLYWGMSAGDILRACATVSNVIGAWTLENNATCGGITTAGQNNTEGPGGGEYYFGENYINASSALLHDEVSTAGLAQLPGAPDVAQTVYGPIQNGPIPSGGVRWLNNSNGTLSRSYQVYSSTFDPGNNLFGKANGLGDLDAICVAAPLEVGNRVWFDANNNGLQDAGETPLANVTVRLYSITGTLLATTTTNASGEYYFNNANVPAGVQPFTSYRIRLDNPADYASGGPLAGLLLTTQNVGGSSSPINSKASYVSSFPEISLTTGGPGANEHVFDYGFVAQQDTPTPTATSTSTPTSTPTSTSTATPTGTGTPTATGTSTGTPTATATGTVFTLTPDVDTATPTGTPPTTPPPSQVPEGDSLILVGTGLAGLAGYAHLRWRARRSRRQ